MGSVPLDRLDFDAAAQLTSFQPLLTLARETIPQATAVEARRALTTAASRLRLELVENGQVVPTFLLLPPPGTTPLILLFGTWHAEALPVTPAAIEGAERLALAGTLAALEALGKAAALGPAAGPPEAAVVVAPGATQGSLVLAETLRTHRPRLQAPVALWPRVSQGAPRRRRVFLGSRGRVVIGLWGEGPNAYAIRDQVVRALSEDAYGPRPLDFELLRKLAGSAEAMDFLEESLADAGASRGAGEERLKRALFDPIGHVLRPAVRHPDRPQAWITIETAEAMEPDDVLRRVRQAAPESRAELAEGFPWDRIGIHHPAARALIGMAKSRSEGPELWPMAPWPTPSGLFTRSLGVGLAEWAVPLPPATMVRFPKPEAFEAMAREMAELALRGMGSTDAESTQQG